MITHLLIAGWCIWSAVRTYPKLGWELLAFLGVAMIVVSLARVR